MKNTSIIIVVVFVLVCFFSVAIPVLDRKEISRLVQAQGHKAIKIEACFFRLGPFFYKNKHQRIYRVETEGPVYWFRSRSFGGFDIAQETP